MRIDKISLADLLEVLERYRKMNVSEVNMIVEFKEDGQVNITFFPNAFLPPPGQISTTDLPFNYTYVTSTSSSFPNTFSGDVQNKDEEDDEDDEDYNSIDYQDLYQRMIDIMQQFSAMPSLFSESSNKVNFPFSGQNNKSNKMGDKKTKEKETEKEIIKSLVSLACYFTGVIN